MLKLEMKVYSIDLRQKIIDVYENEEISQRQLAKRFRVALSFIVKLLKQYRETGEIAPKPFGGGVKFKLTPEQLESLANLIEQRCNFRRTVPTAPGKNRSYGQSCHNGTDGSTTEING